MSEVLRASTNGRSAAGARRTLHYVMFNDGWDRVVANRMNQMTRLLRPGESQQAVQKYLEYLVHSLESFARHHAPGTIPIDIRLIKISPDGLTPEELRALVASRLAGLDVSVTTVPYSDVADFVDEAVRMPEHVYRSPNRLHEAVCFRILAESSCDVIAIVDPDVTFLRDNALDDMWGALLAADDKWAAAFVETGKRRPHGGGWIEMRDRMHSVVVFFKVPEIRRHVRFEPFLRPTSLETRLAAVRDPAALAYYRRHLTLDTFNILTEVLRGSNGCDRLLNLNECMPRFHEGQMLTLVCEQIIHCKYMDPTSRFALQEALQHVGLDVPPVPPETADLLRLAREH